MSLNLDNDFGYDDVFELVQQLSPEEQRRLAQNLPAAKSEEELEKKRQELIRLSLECPTATEEEIELQDESKMFRGRPELPKKKKKLSREEYAKMLLGCPVMTDEEFEEFEKTRKDLRDDFNRRLGFFDPD